ncbi:class I SAM-dependent methyltransferase [Sporomusa carbonis]|uniref:class I SAM-dependent methyltransferase n=1 Tax=Sporomusa carbonis TaxID=3076075 RepID=UPI003C7CC2DB
MELIGFSGSDLILDVGCGTGVLIPFSRNVINENGHITAIDSSNIMIERAKKKSEHYSNITLYNLHMYRWQSCF